MPSALIPAAISTVGTAIVLVVVAGLILRARKRPVPVPVRADRRPRTR